MWSLHTEAQLSRDRIIVDTKRMFKNKGGFKIEGVLASSGGREYSKRMIYREADQAHNSQDLGVRNLQAVDDLQ